MAFSTSIYTMIPLDRVAYYLGVDMYHFNQIYTDLHPVEGSSCDDVWMQYAYQRYGRISREDLAMALKQAEEVTSTFLGWTPIPRWHEEQVQLPQHYDPARFSWVNARGMMKSVESSWAYVQAVGTRTAALLDTPTVVFVDNDGDGYSETAQVTVASATEYDSDEIYVFFEGTNAAETWEIRPLTSVTYNSTTLQYTIEFPRYLIPLRDLLYTYPTNNDPSPTIDGDVIGNFESEVDVYRVYSDTSAPITYLMEPVPGSSTTITTSSINGDLMVRDSRRGVLAYSLPTNLSSACFINPPITGTIRYKAGWQDNTKAFPSRQMREDLERMIIYFALSKLDKDKCGCAGAGGVWDYLTEDFAKSTPEGSFTYPWDGLANPFGTSRAALDLYNYVQPLRSGKSPYER